MTKPRLAVLASGVALAGLTLASAGCTAATGTNPSGSPSASPYSSVQGSGAAVCADAHALRVSVDKLRDTPVESTSADQLKAEIVTVKGNLTAFIEDAHGQWQPQVDALRAALVTLQTAVTAEGASPGAAQTSTVRAAIGGVGVAAQDLYSAVRGTCASASPSPSS